MKDGKMIDCPHCLSNDVTAMRLVSTGGSAGCYVTVLGQKGWKDHSITPHICLDCGMIFVPAEKLQAIKNTRDASVG